MMIYSLTLLMVSFGLSIILATTPVSLGAWILILALLTSSTLGSATYSWFGFIIFLIYIGGMLVMFAYFAAIQPNQEMKMKPSLTLLLLTLLALPLPLKTPIINSITSNSPSIWVLFSQQNIPILLILGLILFLALVAVVKISQSSAGPLRPFNFYV
uniref:NADH dehydrogenase subunit 6 n=1 Tax=Leocrates chinensis TaxID=378359 RepID=UPI0021D52F06|nr:NADH dehydrogenase subunit 6 [Leocrates chinensis]UXC96460.1 NADH dehydrogenase subunit 6 [Leocrates chinensis]